MEIIKKKICLEDFICRVPGMNTTLNSDSKKIQENPNGSFGEIPYNVIINGNVIVYRNLMSLYYDILKIVMEADYYEYDASANDYHWLKLDYDWRDTFNDNVNIKFSSEFPTGYINDRTLIGLIKADDVNKFYDTVYDLFKDTSNGIDLIKKVNNINGRIIVPYANKCKACGKIHYALNPKQCPNCTNKEFERIQGTHVPYFLYYKDVQKFIDLLTQLKSDKCCEKQKYEEYGGDAFYTYLTSIKENGWDVYNSNEIPTLNIPILLTSKLYDIGLYRTYDVDIIDEGEGEINNNTNISPSLVIKTKDESKLQTLRKRKQSLDDDNNKLPFIINKNDKGEYQIEMPYEIGYVKNVTLNSDGKLYGDAIYSMTENCEVIETNEVLYDYIGIPDNLQINGTIEKPIPGVSSESINKLNTSFKYTSKTREEVIALINNDTVNLTRGIANHLKNYIKTDKEKRYPKTLGVSQMYRFTYEIKYGVEVELEEPTYDKNGNIITTQIKEESDTVINEGKICVIYDKPEIEVVYVLGGRFKLDISGIGLDFNETPPFSLDSPTSDEWDGEGMWYKETFPMKKACATTIMYNGEEHTFYYDEIDFESKEMIYEFDNIDFPRKKYILCNEVMYNSSIHSKDSTNDFIFKDEKMLGLNFPLKETYDVLVERGASVAFEKHLQLCDVKTWQDLENYRNGMFLNK